MFWELKLPEQAIFNEISEVIEFDSTYINYHHLSLLCDRMTCNDKMVSIFRHGINNDNIGPIAKASFEETPEMFLKAARHAELDEMRGISANVMCGQAGYFGTGSCQLFLDMEEIGKINEEGEWEEENIDQLIQEEFGTIENPNNPCSMSKITIQSNVSNIKHVDLGGDDDYNPDF